MRRLFLALVILAFAANECNAQHGIEWKYNYSGIDWMQHAPDIDPFIGTAYIIENDCLLKWDSYSGQINEFPISETGIDENGNEYVVSYYFGWNGLEVLEFIFYEDHAEYISDGILYEKHHNNDTYGGVLPSYDEDDEEI